MDMAQKKNPSNELQAENDTNSTRVSTRVRIRTYQFWLVERIL